MVGQGMWDKWGKRQVLLCVNRGKGCLCGAPWTQVRGPAAAPVCLCCVCSLVLSGRILMWPAQTSHRGLWIHTSPPIVPFRCSADISDLVCPSFSCLLPPPALLDCWGSSTLLSLRPAAWKYPWPFSLTHHMQSLVRPGRLQAQCLRGGRCLRANHSDHSRSSSCPLQPV